MTQSYAQPCDRHEYIESTCPDCGRIEAPVQDTPTEAVTDEMIDAGVAEMGGRRTSGEAVAAIYTAMQAARPIAPVQDDAMIATLDLLVAVADLSNPAAAAAITSASAMRREFTAQPGFNEQERAAIRQMGSEMDLSDAQVLRQALRHYQSDHERLKAGETCSWSGDAQRAADFAGPRAIAPVQDDDAERVIRDLAGKLYHHAVTKYDPAAAERCIVDAIARLSTADHSLVEALTKIRRCFVSIPDHEDADVRCGNYAFAITAAIQTIDAALGKQSADELGDKP